jgi:hypothetical protein
MNHFSTKGETMFQATFHFPGHQAEQRTIDAMPHVGDMIDGPELQGVLWRVSGTFHNAASGQAEVTMEAVAAPQIVGDAQPCPLQS